MLKTAPTLLDRSSKARSLIQQDKKLQVQARRIVRAQYTHGRIPDTVELIGRGGAHCVYRLKPARKKEFHVALRLTHICPMPLTSTPLLGEAGAFEEAYMRGKKTLDFLVGASLTHEDIPIGFFFVSDETRGGRYTLEDIGEGLFKRQTPRGYEQLFLDPVVWGSTRLGKRYFLQETRVELAPRRTQGI
ncbi:hypothetical protein GF342_01055 [Candidatus Woesearchaeota archaeon]|nr:hypothetical protein [Candidatus Woesearchaeota archaeon]